MPINPDAVGVTGDLLRFSWSPKDALLYAISVGAGTPDLVFSTENTIGIPQQVLPTFAVVAGMDSGGFETSAMSRIGTFDMAMGFHGSEEVELHRPIPVAGEAECQDRVTAIYDKGKAAVVVLESQARLPDGEPLWTLRATTFLRGEGGWGGDRGPSGARNTPPDRSPDHEVTLQTSVDQALLYRLNGDRNPLHSDPSFSARAGFETPILHGLCTYGFTGRGLLRAYCDNDPARLRLMDGRFSSTVLPGDALTVRSWLVDEGVAVFTTAVGDRTVLDQGLVRFE